MQVILLGVSHRTAPVELRERLDFSSRDLGAAVEALALRPSAAESVVSSDPAQARQEVTAFLSEYHNLPPAAFAPHLFSYENDAAVEHLFSVAAGLDSIVVGEPQVLGQVKDAFQAAAERHRTGPLLSKLFHWSFLVGKRVRSETGLGEGAVSVSFAAVALARKIFGQLTGRRVLVVGAGEISTLTAQHLRSNGVGEILVTSRTPAHADMLAASVNGRSIGWDDLSHGVAAADIVITSTGSQRPIITRAHVEAVTGRHRRGPLFIIDIAVPRDVDASVADIEQVFLYNVDDLQTLVQENLSRRSSEVERAQTIVREELAKFAAWRRSRGAVPTIVALRERFDRIRRSELNRLDGKLSGLPPDSRARVDEVTRLIVEKLLLEPTEQLKALPDEETQVAYTEAINRLFRLRETEPLPSADEAAAEATPVDRRGK
jgi:glutamyl-tRNA reductase